MNSFKMSPEEWEVESLRLHASNQERSKVALRAVEEMSKHPSSLEQMREQAARLRRDANRLEKRRLRITRGQRRSLKNMPKTRKD